MVQNIMLRLYASDPLYQEWDELMTMYAQIKNPQCHYDLQNYTVIEWLADVAAWKARVEALFEELTR